MAEFKRSQMSFRRQGSSGMVWDDKFLTEEIEKVEQEKAAAAAAAAAGGGGGEGRRKSSADNNKAAEVAGELQRSKSDGGRGGVSKQTAYKTVKVAEMEDPPSPKVAACGFCSFFGKPADTGKQEAQRKKKSGKK